MVDAAHDHQPIVAGVGSRRVVAVVCTHGHNDHINAAVPLAEAVDAPIWLHPDDRMLWDVVWPDRAPDADLADGQVIEVGGSSLEVLHTPGHSPGGCCLSAADRGRPLLGRHALQRGSRAPPAAASRTTTPSWPASAPGCSASPPTPSCTPVTATTPRSAPKPPALPTGDGGGPGGRPGGRRVRHRDSCALGAWAHQLHGGGGPDRPADPRPARGRLPARALRRPGPRRLHGHDRPR